MSLQGTFSFFEQVHSTFIALCTHYLAEDGECRLWTVRLPEHSVIWSHLAHTLVLLVLVHLSPAISQLLHINSKNQHLYGCYYLYFDKHIVNQGILWKSIMKDNHIYNFVWINTSKICWHRQIRRQLPLNWSQQGLGRGEYNV